MWNLRFGAEGSVMWKRTGHDRHRLRMKMTQGPAVALLGGKLVGTPCINEHRPLGEWKIKPQHRRCWTQAREHAKSDRAVKELVCARQKGLSCCEKDSSTEATKRLQAKKRRNEKTWSILWNSSEKREPDERLRERPLVSWARDRDLMG